MDNVTFECGDCNMCKVPSRSADAFQRCIKNIMDAQKNTEGGHTRGPLARGGGGLWCVGVAVS
jgi:hypothetical protein